MAEKTVCILQQQTEPIKISKWKVREGITVSVGRPLLLFNILGDQKAQQRKLKSTKAGTIQKILANEGDVVNPGEGLLELTACSHPTIMNDMCAECGADLRKDDIIGIASVPMIHAIPDLKVSEEVARKLGQADSERLIKDRKLVLLVDLDQTLIHTTNDNIPPNIKDVYHFQLHGPNSPWYHTRLRPATHQFLNNIHDYYELHICTFGARNYAHTIALFLDGDQKIFSNRILSRDECFDPNSKKANLRALFPCGDDMVCIIDDREDVWSHATNLIHVKPYHFFQHTGDINAPPGLDKHDNDDQGGVDLTKIRGKVIKKKMKTFENDKLHVSEKEDKSLENGDNIKKENGKIGNVKEEVKPSLKPSSEECKIEKNGVDNKTHENEESIEKSIDKTEKIETLTDKDDEKIEIKDSLKENNDSENEDMKQQKTIQEEPEESGKREDNDLIEIEDPDDYLIYLEEILKLIHKEFYEEYDLMESGAIPDLKKVIPRVRCNVLRGCHLAFSGLVPTHVKLEQSKAYQVARSLGATVTQDIQESTTHLVAVRPGTAKVNAGRRRRRLRIVTPDWLWCCAERWERVDERIFPLSGKGSKNRHPPAHCGSPPRLEEPAPAARKRTASGRFMDTINPLMSFSRDDIADMDKEVEDILDDDSESSDDDLAKTDSPLEGIAELIDRSTSDSDDSMTGEFPKGFKRKRAGEEEQEVDLDESDEEDSPVVRFRRGEAVDDVLDFEQEDTQGSVEEGDEGEWNMMGAALEREFLSDD